MRYKKFQIYFFLAFLTLSVILSLIVFRSYLTMLVLGGVLAVISRPLYLRLNRFFRSETASAFLTVVIVALLLVLPTAYFFAALASELGRVIGNARSYFDPSAFSATLEHVLPVGLRDQVPAVVGVLQRLTGTIATGLSSKLLGFFSDVFGVLIGFFIMLIAAYYFTKDGTRIRKSLTALSPLGDQYDELIFQRVTATVRAVVSGVLILGLIKGILAAISFWAVGISAPLFWGVMTGIAAFIPLIGTAIVTIPAVVFLLINGHLTSAIVLGILAVVAIGAVDNVLQPKIVQSKTDIHPLLVLLSILGGIEFYGFPGFVLGPLTLAVMLALIDIYKREFRNYVFEGDSEERKG